MDERESSSNRGEQVDFGEVVGRDFADKLLLAIIDAHPGPEEPNREHGKDRLIGVHRLQLADGRDYLLRDRHDIGPRCAARNADTVTFAEGTHAKGEYRAIPPGSDHIIKSGRR